MNGVEKLIAQRCIEELEHAVSVFRSLADRGKYPQELCPFYLTPEKGISYDAIHPLFLGKQGYIGLILAAEAMKELINKEKLCDHIE